MDSPANFSLQGWPPAILEFACAFEAYRRLGFSPEDIFFSCGRGSDTEAHIFAILRTQGRQFALDCGPARCEDPEAWYRRLHAEFKTVPAEEFQAAWEWSFVGNHPLPLVVSMLAKGFYFPRCQRPESAAAVDPEFVAALLRGGTGLSWN